MSFPHLCPLFNLQNLDKPNIHLPYPLIELSLTSAHEDVLELCNGDNKRPPKKSIKPSFNHPLRFSGATTSEWLIPRLNPTTRSSSYLHILLVAIFALNCCCIFDQKSKGGSISKLAPQQSQHSICSCIFEWLLWIQSFWGS